jgi:hypothetical protein
MKQKKWITYGLGVVVIAVWGIVLQRIFAATAVVEQESSVKIAAGGSSKIAVPVLQPDTFALLLNYQDPFEAKDVRNGEFPAVDARPAAIVAALPIPVVKNPLDEVVYLGYILNPQTKKRVAILSVAGKEHMVQEGNAVNKMKLLRIANDEISIGYEGKIKKIKSKP